MRTPTLLLIASVTAQPLAGQGFVRPANWHVRFDSPAATEADLQAFASMPPGWHVSSGPAAIYWAAGANASGEYRLELEVFLFDPEGRREPFGLFLGGRDLEGGAPTYLAFLVREGGQVAVEEHRGHDGATHLPWASHDAVRSFDERDGTSSVRNVLAVVVGVDEVRFVVNGDEVGRLPRADLRVDGTYGVRVSDALNLHVSRVELTPAR